MRELGNFKPLEVWALVPIKSPIWAKTRLAEMLSESERAFLQRAMLEDMLDQLRAAKWLAGVAIVCPDKGIQALAQARGVKVIGDEPQGGGLNAALTHGAEVLRAGGADLLVMLLGDLPMLDAADIDRAVMHAIHENTTVVVPDQNREGTNALVLWTDRMPQLQFGKNSFRRHSRGVAQGPVTELPLASVAHDIDWPDDLDTVRRRRGQGAAPNTNSALANCAYLKASQEAEENR